MTMSSLQVEIVTPEGPVYAGEAEQVDVITTSGEVVILPRHAPLLTWLMPGALTITPPAGDSLDIAISGGFMEVRDNQVVILADTAERAEAIDVDRARRARESAEQMLRERPQDADLVRAEAALRRSTARLKVVERAARRRGSRQQRGPGPSSE